MSEELMPCPLCGGMAAVCATGYRKYIGCLECGCKGPDQISAFEAIAAWNRRTPEPGTSVVRWVRYDGEVNTLPDRGKWILVFQKGDIAPIPGELAENPLNYYRYFQRCDEQDTDIEVGDLWAYLPTPPPPTRAAPSPSDT